MNKEDIARYLIYISGVDVFANSRKRAHVEMRSLLTFILRNQFDMNYHEIKRFYESNNKDYDHATAIHSYKSFEMHRRYNPQIVKYLKLVLLKLKDKSKLRIALINHTLYYSLDKDLNKVLKLVDSLPKADNLPYADNLPKANSLPKKDGEEQTKEKATTNI